MNTFCNLFWMTCYRPVGDMYDVNLKPDLEKKLEGAKIGKN